MSTWERAGRAARESTDARPAGSPATHAPPPPTVPDLQQMSITTATRAAGILGPAFVAAVVSEATWRRTSRRARATATCWWVLVLANCMSVLIQYQSAKPLGIVTGKKLPEIANGLATGPFHVLHAG